MELHPQTAEVMAQLEFDHIENYDYVLADDLKIIVSYKLSRIRKNPIQDVTDIVNNWLLWQPDPPAEGEQLKFENINVLIRDTANYYRALDHKNIKEESVAE